MNRERSRIQTGELSIEEERKIRVIAHTLTEVVVDSPYLVALSGIVGSIFSLANSNNNLLIVSLGILYGGLLSTPFVGALKATEALDRQLSLVSRDEQGKYIPVHNQDIPRYSRLIQKA